MVERRQRRCLVCGKPAKARSASEKFPYHFSDSGLPYVYLVGIEYYQCPNGHTVADIPAIEQLLALIARDVVHKPAALTGVEVKFLRKRLHRKATDFSKEIGIEPETLSRIENDKQQAKESTDKLIRFYYAVSSGDSILLEKLKETSLIHAAKWAGARPNKRLVANVRNNEWQTKPVAA